MVNTWVVRRSCVSIWVKRGLLVIVCICKRLNEQTLRECQRDGWTLEDVQWAWGLGSQCGVCMEAARQVFEHQVNTVETPEHLERAP